MSSTLRYPKERGSPDTQHDTEQTQAGWGEQDTRADLGLGRGEQDALPSRSPRPQEDPGSGSPARNPGGCQVASLGWARLPGPN